jgi:hypothetical protein
MNTPERAYIGWINQVESWLNAVDLHSTDSEFDLYDWHAAWAIGLTPLTAVQYAREMVAATAFVMAPIGGNE